MNQQRTRKHVYVTALSGFLCAAFLPWSAIAVEGNGDERVPRWGHNLLLDATLSGNLESFNKGLRGAPEHVVYDLDERCFLKPSTYHEYGVGFGEDLGVVSRQKPAYWMAHWKEPVRLNCIILSGVYSNQPQPNTAWKIELRSSGQWRTHAQGVGGWYDQGRYFWGGPDEQPICCDALRVCLFSKDENNPLRSVHFRGEGGVSWFVGYCPPIDAHLTIHATVPRAGETVRFSGKPVRGAVKEWRWTFGDGENSTGKNVEHVFDKPGEYTVTLTFATVSHQGRIKKKVTVAPPVAARIDPLRQTALAGKRLTFVGDHSLGDVSDYAWDFGDGTRETGKSVAHTFAKPGVHKICLTVTDGTYTDSAYVLLRVHAPDTVGLPQVLLDTDARNEVDDQHYIGYALLSEIDILGINSIHHGGGQEPTNYAEIQRIIKLALASGLSRRRVPPVFHGADRRLAVPESGKWDDTVPIRTEASDAILAAARGASPDNPVWILPVGPCTNIASAILLARDEGLDLKSLIRVCWLGGGPDHAEAGSFNGRNDPWSVYVMGHSDVPFWVLLENPTGASLRIDKRSESSLYPDNPLGRYLVEITPIFNWKSDRPKSLYDVTTISTVISEYLELGWIKQCEPATVLGPDHAYAWKAAEGPTTMQIIRQIDARAMKNDFFRTLNSRATRLKGKGR